MTRKWQESTPKFSEALLIILIADCLPFSGTLATEYDTKTIHSGVIFFLDEVARDCLNMDSVCG